MSLSIDLHSTDSNSVTVRDFSAENDTRAFSTITVRDFQKNGEVTLYFANLAEVMNFSLMVQQEMRNALKAKK